MTDTRYDNLTIQRYETDVPVQDYCQHCVDIPYFRSLCKQCENFGTVWSCPPYDFDPADFWKEYQILHIIGEKIQIPQAIREKALTKEEQEEVTAEILWNEKSKLNEELFQMEAEIPGSRLLSAGYCREGGPKQYVPRDKGTRRSYCTRKDGKPCRQPERMRYSIESIGGDVTKTLQRYFQQEIQWIENGKLPEYFFLVAGLLKK